MLYLESDPKGIDASSPRGQHGSPVPDVRQMFIPRQQVQEWSSQRALVLGTGHDEVIHYHWCKHQQEKDAGQGKPVHLPAIQNRAFGFPSLQAHEFHQTIFFREPSRLSWMKTEKVFRAWTCLGVKEP